VLLVAGSLALEREENTYARLTQAAVGPGRLLASKLLLGAAASLVVSLLLLAALTPFVAVAWERLPLILAALVVGGAAVAAFGAAIGSLAREVRAASLLAFMTALPVTFLSLIPSGVVGETLFDVARVLRALFPFDPALDAIAAALDRSGGGIGEPLAHLLALALAYAALARVALRRFA
jgi:ABC-2 type transport system permease protein